jgi:hypothetical protein
MLDVTSATVAPNTPFTQVINVSVLSTNPPGYVPSTTVPVVTADFVDPGVVITTSVGQVTISGQYTTIIRTFWEYINLANTITTTDQVPTLGTFEMITKVDSPPKLKEICTYTIDGEEFEHTVDLGSYTGIANTLKDLLATVA